MKQNDDKKWSGILVYLECYQGNLHPAGLELLGEAQRLAAESKEEISAAVIGQQLDRVKEKLRDYPISQVFLYESKDEYHPGLYQKIMISCMEKLRPAIVLIGGTPEGRALAPGLAVHFRTGLTADCTALGIDEEGCMVQTRPAFGGNVMADIVTRVRRPQFATVRPGVMTPMEKAADAEVKFRLETIEMKDADVRIISTETVPEENSIAGQEILVVAGRGVKKKEDLDMLRELAELLGGKLASSRALVEKGWMSPEEQIGLSGHTVAPQYMITCGVSGTVQFMAGMKHTKNIIAINNDPEARIFEIAHYPICGDLYEMVPELIARLKERKQNGKTETALSAAGR